MIALWIVALFASGVLIRRVEKALFKRRRFDTHTALALAVVAEPSDDWDLWAAEIRGAA